MKFIIDREVIKGHDNYFSIMNLIANPSIDVSSNKEFQKAYSGYYFPAQVDQRFKDFYFFTISYQCVYCFSVMKSHCQRSARIAAYTAVIPADPKSDACSFSRKKPFRRL